MAGASTGNRRGGGLSVVATDGCGYESPEDDSGAAAPHRPMRQDRDRVQVRDLEAGGCDSPLSLTGMVNKARHLGDKVTILDRIACFRWTWFTMTMATGGIANVLYSRKFNMLGCGSGVYI